MIPGCVWRGKNLASRGQEHEDLRRRRGEFSTRRRQSEQMMISGIKEAEKQEIWLRRFIGGCEEESDIGKTAVGTDRDRAI